MIQIDLLTLSLQIVSILLFMAVIRAFLVKPILETVERREHELAADKGHAHSLEKELATRLAETEAQRKAVREEVRSYRDGLRRDASEQAAGLLNAAAQRSDAETAAALAALQKNVEDLRPVLEAQAKELATLIEEKLIA